MRVTITALAATLAVSAVILTSSGTAVATTAVTTATTATETRANNGPSAPLSGFFLNYRGHHIMGWGSDASACAYIDGIQLVLYPVGDDRYLSALQAFKEERGVRAITEASVRVLGDLKMNPPSDRVPHCPALDTGLALGN